MFNLLHLDIFVGYHCCNWLYCTNTVRHCYSRYLYETVIKYATLYGRTKACELNEVKLVDIHVNKKMLAVVKNSVDFNSFLPSVEMTVSEGEGAAASPPKLLDVRSFRMKQREMRNLINKKELKLESAPKSLLSEF